MESSLPEDRYIHVGEIKTRYWATGSAGTTVVLLHGLGGFLETWSPNIQALAECHRVYAVDLVGFGRSDKPQVPYSLDFFTQFVYEFMQALHIEHASLIGHCMGGGVSLKLAFRFPEKVDKLFLISCLGFGKDGSIPLRMASVPFVGEAIITPSRKGVRRSLQNIFYNQQLITEEFVTQTCDMMATPEAKKAYLATLRSITGLRGLLPDVQQSFRENLSKITIPVSLIWGKEDRVLPVSHAHTAIQALPHAQLHIFEQCGHIPHVEYPDKCNRLACEFLA